MTRSACHFWLLLFFCSAESAVFSRVKRQTTVGSNAETDGSGDQVLTDASTLHYKTANGTIGMNVTANGNSSGIGTASVGNSVGGNVGNSSVENVANAMSVGDKTNSFTDIFAAVEGEKLTMNAVQQGTAAGQGPSLSTVNGGGTLQNQNGQKQSGFSYGKAGGTGSVDSKAEIETSQAMSWDQLMAKLAGSASATGLGSAQSNLDVGSGSNGNNMSISGLVSGLNSENGVVNALVSGNGTLNGESQNVQGMLSGSSSGKGNSTLVAASSINSNQTSSSEMQAFANSNAYSSGNTSVGLMSNTNIENENGVGVVHVRGSGQGSNNQIISSNGLKLSNSNEDSAFIGSGSIKGVGSDANSRADQNIDTAMDTNGVVRIQSKSDGQSLSNDGTNSSLAFTANGLSGFGKNSSSSATATGSGHASGSTNNVTGGGFIDINGNVLNGNSSMTANGGGEGFASADTHAELKLIENGVVKNGTIDGKVSANGNATNVHSESMISNDEGVQTMNNFQHVSSSGAGSASVSAWSYGTFKRRKRFIVLRRFLNK